MIIWGPDTYQPGQNYIISYKLRSQMRDAHDEIGNNLLLIEEFALISRLIVEM